jgi:hypothetical protein
VIRLANLSNGLAFPHDDICHFQSNWAHHCSLGYFRIDSMPLSAVRHLLTGGSITVVDGSRHHRLSDALHFGVVTWCMVFNRALRPFIGSKDPICTWETTAMTHAAMATGHRPLVHTIRKLVKLYGATGPAVIGRNVHLICHQVDFDDKVSEIRKRL